MSRQGYAGRVFGLTAVIERAGPRRWRCQCGACGKVFVAHHERIATGAAARGGCGCARKRAPSPPGPAPRIIVPLTENRGDR